MTARPTATILVVDDELQNRKLLEALLGHEGYLTQSAASGEEALASIAQHAPDLILLDIMMPGMDGYQVAGLLKADPATSNIPIIMVTAKDDRGARIAGLAAGAEDFLTKPVDRAELWLRVRNLLRLKELGDLLQNHGAMLEQQVQQQVEAIRASELSYRRLFEAAQDGILILDIDTGRINDVNPFLFKLLGFTRSEMVGLTVGELSPFRDIESNQIMLERLQKDGYVRYEDLPLETKDGRKIAVEFVSNVYQAGDRKVIQCNVRDITARKKAVDKIVQLNRVYAVLSGINTLIVRVRDRDELFNGACRIAVDTGKFLTADILMVDADSNQATLAASSSNDTHYLEALRKATVNPAPEALAFRAGFYSQRQPLVVNDIENDLPASLQDGDRAAGSLSACVLPLVILDKTVGLLTLRARVTGFFDVGEMKLLLELAGDIAFAMDHLDKRDRLDYLAYYDALTGLANQSLFLERLQEKLLAARNEQRKKAVFVLDIERFRTINDAFGRPAGDDLLKQIAARLVEIGGVDASRLARIGADRFAIVAADLDSVEQAGRYIEQRLNATFRGPFRVSGNDLRVSVRTGIALFPEDGADADTLLRNAEAALKKAKGSGERYLFFTQGMTERVAERLSLENRLRQALDKEEFVLHYQPKVNLQSGKLTSAEALIRWNDPRTGLVPPGQFIPILEETGLIHEVGRWALHKAIEDYLRWRKAGLAVVRIAVNVSPLQLRNRGFIAEIEQAIGIDTHAAAGLELEITESLIMEDVKHSIATLKAIRAMGVSIAIDDFGTGFSSLSYLSKLPVDTLKIDRSFVIDMTLSPDGLALVSTIITLAHALRLKLVAEGVETEEQARLLRLLKCDEMQGYLFSKPVPGEVFETRYLARLPVAPPGPEGIVVAL